MTPNALPPHVRIFPLRVIGILIPDIQSDDNTGRQADCKADDINRTVEFVFEQVVYGDCDVVF